MPRYAFRLPDVTVDRTWSLGPVRLRSTLDLASEIHVIHDERPPPTSAHEALREDVVEVVQSWGEGSVLEVTAPDKETAARLAQEAIAIVRLFMRPEVSVNVDIHRIGL